ncbi:biotin/lipoyl-containing protein [Candidatus Cloacimonadota bacterium]
MKTYEFKINDQKYKARIMEYKNNNVRVEVNGIEYKVELVSDTAAAPPKLVRSEKPSIGVITPVKVISSSNNKGVKAPIPGLVLSLLVKEGDLINKGEPVLILEAMKMESEISANISGKINKILIKEGDSVQEGEMLIEIGE